jgi:hypothetical protein
LKNYTDAASTYQRVLVLQADHSEAMYGLGLALAFRANAMAGAAALGVCRRLEYPEFQFVQAVAGRVRCGLIVAG